jgi:hypothetical protein
MATPRSCGARRGGRGIWRCLIARSEEDRPLLRLWEAVGKVVFALALRAAHRRVRQDDSRSRLTAFTEAFIERYGSVSSDTASLAHPAAITVGLAKQLIALQQTVASGAIALSPLPPCFFVQRRL